MAFKNHEVSVKLGKKKINFSEKMAKIIKLS